MRQHISSIKELQSRLEELKDSGSKDSKSSDEISEPTDLTSPALTRKRKVTFSEEVQTRVFATGASSRKSSDDSLVLGSSGSFVSAGAIVKLVSSSTALASGEDSAEPKPILRSSIASATELQRLVSIESQRQSAIFLLSQATAMKKMTKKLVLQDRLFWVSSDGTELRYSKRTSVSASSLRTSPVSATRLKLSGVASVELASVERIVLGPRSRRFIHYDWASGNPWLCFSLFLAPAPGKPASTGKTVDLELRSEEEVIQWVLGLQALCAPTGAAFTRAKIRWQCALYRSVQSALKERVPVRQLWDKLAAKAKRETVVSSIAMQMSPSSSGDDSEEAAREWSKIVKGEVSIGKVIAEVASMDTSMAFTDIMTEELDKSLEHDV